ncbi:YigZ family protein [Ruminococcus sp.]|uniref:YigZ family protein n=1 Tax=Ruminococcus sp. TaxID=41978 RepID=UPI0025E0BBA3|nr:YigZ family protein [Ruminococcus sp.]MBQ8966434.1 YigZ family protein [Ruminococcus sp.]
MDYKTVYGYASDSFVEKKSEFIGHIMPVQTPEQAVTFIEKIKAENRKARHNVYAYVLREGNVSRYSDDGEPQGTGGVPVLDVINKAGLTDVCVVVTRYFGGILLGASGLVRAYSQACSLAVGAAKVMEMCLCSRISFSCDYTLYGKVSYLLPEFGVINEKEDFADKVNMAVLVKDEQAEALKRRLTDVSNGQLSWEEDKGLWADFSGK